MLKLPKWALVGFYALAFLIWIAFAGYWASSERPTFQKTGNGDYSAADKTSNAEEQKSLWQATTDDPVALFTFWIAVLTGVLAFSTIGLWVTAILAGRKQSRDMVASIAAAEAANKINREIMIASRRAWLSIDDAKLKHPTAFAADGITFAVNITVKNHGQTPATSVFVKFESYFPKSSSEKFAAAESRFKAQLRAHPIELGDLLFPQDTLIQGQTWWADVAGAPIGTPPSDVFIIFIGVSYRIAGDKAAHITHHAHSTLIAPVGTAVPLGSLIDLPRMPFAAGEAD